MSMSNHTSRMCLSSIALLSPSHTITQHPHFTLKTSLTLVSPQVSHRSPMPHMEEAPYINQEYGTCNPSFSFPENPDIYTHQTFAACQGPVPLNTTAAPDSIFISTESPQSPGIFDNNVFTPTKSSSSSPTFNLVTVDGSLTAMVQESSPPQDNQRSLAPAHDITLDPTEPLNKTSLCSGTDYASNTLPFTCLDSETTQTTNDDAVDPVTSPSSQSSIPCSHTRIAAAEIDKPFRKPRVKTPPYSPLLSTSLFKPISTPPPTPENVPLKAKLVHIDTSPLDTPPATPGRTSTTLSTDIDQPSTSLDQTDQSNHLGADGTTQDGCKVGQEDDDGFLGDEDADKNSDDDDELASDEEELLRVMARCNPIFITFSK